MWLIRAGSHTFGKPKDMAKDRLRQKLNPNSNATPQCFSASFSLTMIPLWQAHLVGFDPNPLTVPTPY